MKTSLKILALIIILFCFISCGGDSGCGGDDDDDSAPIDNNTTSEDQENPDNSNQDPGNETDDPNPEENEYQIVIHVSDNRSGSVIQGADVIVETEAGVTYQGKTDADGYFISYAPELGDQLTITAFHKDEGGDLDYTAVTLMDMDGAKDEPGDSKQIFIGLDSITSAENPSGSFNGTVNNMDSIEATPGGVRIGVVEVSREKMGDAGFEQGCFNEACTIKDNHIVHIVNESGIVEFKNEYTLKSRTGSNLALFVTGGEFNNNEITWKRFGIVTGLTLSEGETILQDISLDYDLSYSTDISLDTSGLEPEPFSALLVVYIDMGTWGFIPLTTVIKDNELTFENIKSLDLSLLGIEGATYKVSTQLTSNDEDRSRTSYMIKTDLESLAETITFSSFLPPPDRIEPIPSGSLSNNTFRWEEITGTANDPQVYSHNIIETVSDSSSILWSIIIPAGSGEVILPSAKDQIITSCTIYKWQIYAFAHDSLYNYQDGELRRDYYGPHITHTSKSTETFIYPGEGCE